MKEREKQFLNDSHEEFGYVSWRVSVDKMGHNYYPVNSSLHIADCSDKITLDFDCRDTKSIDKRIAKLDVLIDSLLRMRTTLCKAQELLAKGRKFYY